MWYLISVMDHTFSAIQICKDISKSDLRAYTFLKGDSDWDIFLNDSFLHHFKKAACHFTWKPRSDSRKLPCIKQSYAVSALFQ